MCLQHVQGSGTEEKINHKYTGCRHWLHKGRSWKKKYQIEFSDPRCQNVESYWLELLSGYFSWPFLIPKCMLLELLKRGFTKTFPRAFDCSTEAALLLSRHSWGLTDSKWGVGSSILPCSTKGARILQHGRLQGRVILDIRKNIFTETGQTLEVAAHINGGIIIPGSVHENM